jgi:KDO2-lipid IV(A) lauroyltransferase
MGDSRPLPTLAHHAEYMATRALATVLGPMPWRLASAFGAGVARLGYAPLGIRRAVVDEHLRQSFPQLSSSARAQMAKEAYGNLGRTTIEATALAGASAEQVLARFDGAEGWELLEAAHAQGRGVLLVSGHVGNWEIAGAYVAARGLPIDVVARRLQNPLVDRYVQRTREQLGMTVVRDKDAVRHVPRALRENHIIALLSDNDVITVASTFVPFLGRWARTPRGPAVFALRQKVPLLFAAALRQPSGRYRFLVRPVPIPEVAAEEAVDALVASYTRVLEDVVRAYPSQYFWQHRRWKRQPPGNPPLPDVGTAASIDSE